MSDTARDDYKTIEPATTEGLEDLFDVEAARKLGIPYTTFYKQVKAGKHHTVCGTHGKQRVILQVNPGDTPGVTPISLSGQEVTLGVFQSSEGVTEAYHLKVIEQLSN
jgi:hypothetical protein